MSKENPERFLDLAMMKIAGEASEAELAELAGLLAADASLQEEYERLDKESQLLKDLSPFTLATRATEGEFPEWARPNLELEVKKVLGRPLDENDPLKWLKEAQKILGEVMEKMPVQSGILSSPGLPPSTDLPSAVPPSDSPQPETALPGPVAAPTGLPAYEVSQPEISQGMAPTPSEEPIEKNPEDLPLPLPPLPPMEDAAGELEAYKRAMWAHEERKEWYKQAIKELAEAGKYRQAMEATYEIVESDIKAAALREIIIAAKAKIPPTP